MLPGIVAASGRRTRLVYRGFDPQKAGAAASIQNDGFDLFTASSGTNRWALSAASKTSGKFRAQLLAVNHANTLGGGVAFNTNIGGFAGATANAAAFFGNYAANTRLYTNNAFSAFAGTIATGDRIDIFVDADAGRVWWGKNGTPIAGNPAAGTGAMYTYPPSTPVFLVGDTTGVNGRIRLRKGSEITDPLPSGFVNGWPG